MHRQLFRCTGWNTHFRKLDKLNRCILKIVSYFWFPSTILFSLLIVIITHYTFDGVDVQLYEDFVIRKLIFRTWTLASCLDIITGLVFPDRARKGTSPYWRRDTGYLDWLVTEDNVDTIIYDALMQNGFANRQINQGCMKSDTTYILKNVWCAIRPVKLPQYLCFLERRRFLYV
jgi:hypothetical protein